METMRAFIAIDLVNEAKEALAVLQSELAGSNADVKWVEPENIHITLKFLGEIAEPQAAQVKETLDKVAYGAKPFEIALSALGAFPKLEYPRVIWVGIEKGKKEIEEIAARIENELGKLGFQSEEREFAAHLTVGRVRSGKNKESLRKKLELLNQKMPPDIRRPQKVFAITLYKSALAPKGPVYTPLHSATFRKSSV